MANRQVKIAKTFQALLAVSPVAIALGWSWRLLAISGLVTVVAYIIIWMFYMFIPWHYKSWNVTTESTVRIKHLLKVIHYSLISVMIGAPLVIIATYELRDNCPTWFDTLVSRTANDSVKFAPITKYSSTIDKTKLPGSNNSFIVVITGTGGSPAQTPIAIVSTKAVFDAGTSDVLDELTILCEVFCALALVFIVVAYIMEVLGPLSISSNDSSKQHVS